MKVIAKHSVGKKVVGDTLQISVEAKMNKAKYADTIDATIGTLSNEDKTFLSYNTVDNIIKNLGDNNFYAYAAVDGGIQYHDAVVEWVFQYTKTEVFKKMHCRVVATPGGTGAVSNAVFCSLDEGETLLLPNIYWGPYKGMAISNSLEVETYPLLKDGKFNLDGFIETANKVIAKQGKLVTILNDPNNNPTGYSLSNDELKELLNYLNSCDVPVSFIYDIAYLDYSINDRKTSRDKFLILAEANKNVLVSIAFSCSKTFSIYGLRTGAHIILGKDHEAVEEFYDSSVYISRSRWSNVSKAGINMLTTLVLNEEKRKKFSIELEAAAEMLKNRTDLFIKEAQEEELNIYPYSGGFFITVIYQDGEKLFSALKKENIFVIPYPHGIRISISALSVSEIKGLAKRIKTVINSL